jgi:hypothetical protein
MQNSPNSKLKWVERVSHLMDEQFRVPGTNFRFGLDPILNFIPLAGDIGGFAVSAVLIFSMARHGVSRKVLILMIMNVILDSTIGAIPVLGNIFDFFYKSNTMNIKLLKEHYNEGKHQGNGNGILAAIALVLILFFLIFIYVAWMVLSWVINAL